MPNIASIKELKIEGFLSIKDANIQFKRLNLLIGANGAGKSNLLNFFRMLNHLAQGELQMYAKRAGGADKLLHYGRKQTNSLSVKISFNRGNKKNGHAYSFRLIADKEDNLVFSNEELAVIDKKWQDSPFIARIGKGGFESALSKEFIGSITENHEIALHIHNCLNAYRLFHFHDTSEGAKVKQAGYINDNRSLNSDAGNLAAFLYRLRETHNVHYKKIVDTIRYANPYFGDFVLEPNPLNPELIRLEWREKLSDSIFSPHALSDGTLRFICLTTLFSQPPELMPAIALLDEPELGLHPFAIHLLAEMMKSASYSMQIIAATQSPVLMSGFEPENILITERVDGASAFKKLDVKAIRIWMEDYSLGEMWEKNLIGGRPK